MPCISLAHAAYVCTRGRRVIVLRAHERVEADTATGVGSGGRAGCSAAPDGLDNFAIEEARVAIVVGSAACKLHLTSLSVAAEWHHEALDVYIADAGLLIHLLNQLGVFSIFL